ncbi:eukaryotic translation initiation factor 3 subunit G-like [Paramacrobiotus metropolitanus]|uniref:eukaryotic translation initiation factor 3 subunit G-like n=1 Tax=Paramacrobiotus metropolitanus TaxID=2943436 RepID=UPI002445906F|nr:eukaryotic translation initiation factor 3 subunit G-like [Paramacrobiotus metropolitanus]
MALYPENTEDQQIDWAGELEDKLEGPKIEIGTKIIGDRKVVTEIREENGQRQKVVSEYKIVVKRVPKAVAQRKLWKKFGDALDDPPGPQTATTVVAEEIQMQFITGREDVMGTDAPTIGIKDKAQVLCRTCGGNHWTTQCQFQGATEAEKAQIRQKFLGVTEPETSTMDISAPEPGGGGKYVPPSRRMGASLPTSSMQQDSFPSIRVSNLPQDVKEEDLRELFDRFGRIKKVYLGKDKKTGDFRGFAFVTFYDQTSADKAISAVNGHRYFHMVLNVDWANPAKS